MMIQNKIYSYFERNENLRVLFLFDPVDEIGAELYDLVWKPGYRYVDFDGCWFRTQYRLEHEWANDKVILRFLRQSPATTKDKQDFPLLGLLVANMEYKNDDYAAFMQHNHIDMRFSQYVQRHIAELQLEKVNKIIGAYYNQSFDINVVNRGMISVYLEASKLLDWDEILVRLLILGLPEEKNKRDSFFRKLIGNKDAQHALDHAVEDYFGVEISYNEEERVKRLVECLKYNAIAQSLAVIPTDRYKGYKITNAYRLQLMNRVLECGLQHVRLSDKFLKTLKLLGKDIQESEIIKYFVCCVAPEAASALPAKPAAARFTASRNARDEMVAAVIASTSPPSFDTFNPWVPGVLPVIFPFPLGVNHTSILEPNPGVSLCSSTE